MVSRTGKVWLPHKDEIVVPGVLASSENGTETYRADNGEMLKFSGQELEKLKPIFDDQLKGVEDICQLSRVDEGAMLHTVRVRYARKEIYTRVAHTLIALNPFGALPAYSQNHVEKYSNAMSSMDLPPHIFGIGVDAVRNLRNTSADQAVLISGESGSGKTESAKLIMSFVIDAMRSCDRDHMERLLWTNPILEAFGNAMTARNSNSSRFGKWLDLKFSSDLLDSRTTLTHYLLETTRVCFQAKVERGFHIFFQLFEAKKSPLVAGLNLKGPRDYVYLKDSKFKATGIDDAKQFAMHVEALDKLGFEESVQREMFTICAIVLNLGNIDFKRDGDGSKLLSMEPLERVTELMGVDGEELKQFLLFRTVVMGKDVTVMNHRVGQAQALRDALAKLLYSRLFQWIVRRLNTALIGEEPMSEAGTRLIGVLDIAGFESFELNSLEQLLINLSNEHLQQKFNQNVLKSEMEDCQKEGIEAPVVEGSFADNNDILTLLDAKGGICHLLDDACTFTSAATTDDSFVNKVISAHQSNKRLIVPKIRAKDPQFGIKHFAGDVVYNAAGWIEKNLETMSTSLVGLLEKSCVGILGDIAEIVAETQGTGARKAATVSARFRSSLRELMAKISKACPHYIRCIKPNQACVPGRFHAISTLEQLLFSGVLAAVHIRQQGYALRMPFQEFNFLYACIVEQFGDRSQLTNVPPNDHKAYSQALVLAMPAAFEKASIQGSLTSAFKVGLTKVFTKFVAVKALEEGRNKALMSSSVRIQKLFRGFLVRRMAAKMSAIRSDIRTLIDKSWPSVRGRGLSALPTRPQEDSMDVSRRPSKEAYGRLMTARCLETWEGGCFVLRLHPIPVAKWIERSCVALIKQAEEIDFVNLDVLISIALQKRIKRELFAIDALEDHKTSIDPVAIDKALAQVRSLGIPDTPTAEYLDERTATLKKQLPVYRAVESAYDLVTQPLLADAKFQQALEALKEATLEAIEVERWLSELSALDLLKDAVEVLTLNDVLSPDQIEDTRACVTDLAVKNGKFESNSDKFVASFGPVTSLTLAQTKAVEKKTAESTLKFQKAVLVAKAKASAKAAKEQADKTEELAQKHAEQFKEVEEVIAEYAAKERWLRQQAEATKSELDESRAAKSSEETVAKRLLSEVCETREMAVQRLDEETRAAERGFQQLEAAREENAQLQAKLMKHGADAEEATLEQQEAMRRTNEDVAELRAQLAARQQELSETMAKHGEALHDGKREKDALEALISNHLEDISAKEAALTEQGAAFVASKLAEEAAMERAEAEKAALQEQIGAWSTAHEKAESLHRSALQEHVQLTAMIDEHKDDAEKAKAAHVAAVHKAMADMNEFHEEITELSIALQKNKAEMELAAQSSDKNKADLEADIERRSAMMASAREIHEAALQKKSQEMALIEEAQRKHAEIAKEYEERHHEFAAEVKKQKNLRDAAVHDGELNRAELMAQITRLKTQASIEEASCQADLMKKNHEISLMEEQVQKLRAKFGAAEDSHTKASGHYMVECIELQAKIEQQESAAAEVQRTQRAGLRQHADMVAQLEEKILELEGALHGARVARDAAVQDGEITRADMTAQLIAQKAKADMAETAYQANLQSRHSDVEAMEAEIASMKAMHEGAMEAHGKSSRRKMEEMEALQAKIDFHMEGTDEAKSAHQAALRQGARDVAGLEAKISDLDSALNLVKASRDSIARSNEEFKTKIDEHVAIATSAEAAYKDSSYKSEEERSALRAEIDQHMAAADEARTAEEAASRNNAEDISALEAKLEDATRSASRAQGVFEINLIRALDQQKAMKVHIDKQADELASSAAEHAQQSAKIEAQEGQLTEIMSSIAATDDMHKATLQRRDEEHREMLLEIERHRGIAGETNAERVAALRKGEDDVAALEAKIVELRSTAEKSQAENEATLSGSAQMLASAQEEVAELQRALQADRAELTAQVAEREAAVADVRRMRHADLAAEAAKTAQLERESADRLSSLEAAESVQWLKLQQGEQHIAELRSESDEHGAAAREAEANAQMALQKGAEEVADLRAKVSECEAAIAEAKNTHEATLHKAEAQAEASHDAMRLAHEEALRLKQREVERLDHEISKHLEAAGNAAELHQTRMQKYEQDIAELRSGAAELKSAVDEARATQKATAEVSESDVAAMQAKVMELEALQRSTRSTYEAALEKAESEKTELESQVSKISATMQAAMDAQKETSARRDKEKAAIEAEIAKLCDAASAAENAYKAASEASEQERAALKDNMGRHREAAEKSKAMLEASMEQAAREAETVEAKISGLASAVDDARAERDVSMHRYEAFEAEFQAVMSQQNEDFEDLKKKHWVELQKSGNESLLLQALHAERVTATEVAESAQRAALKKSERQCEMLRAQVAAQEREANRAKAAHQAAVQKGVENVTDLEAKIGLLRITLTRVRTVSGTVAKGTVQERQALSAQIAELRKALEAAGASHRAEMIKNDQSKALLQAEVRKHEATEGELSEQTCAELKAMIHKIETTVIDAKERHREEMRKGEDDVIRLEAELSELSGAGDAAGIEQQENLQKCMLEKAQLVAALSNSEVAHLKALQEGDLSKAEMQARIVEQLVEGQSLQQVLSKSEGQLDQRSSKARAESFHAVGGCKLRTKPGRRGSRLSSATSETGASAPVVKDEHEMILAMARAKPPGERTKMEDEAVSRLKELQDECAKAQHEFSKFEEEDLDDVRADLEAKATPDSADIVERIAALRGQALSAENSAERRFAAAQVRFAEELAVENMKKTFPEQLAEKQERMQEVRARRTNLKRPRASIPGYLTSERRQILEALDKAVCIYDLPAIERLLLAVTLDGIEDESTVAPARKLFEDFQNRECVTISLIKVQDTVSSMEAPDISFTSLSRLYNLSEQLRRVCDDRTVANSAYVKLHCGLVTLAKRRNLRSLFDSSIADEQRLAAQVYGNLYRFSRAKDPSMWSVQRPPELRMRRRSHMVQYRNNLRKSASKLPETEIDATTMLMFSGNCIPESLTLAPRGFKQDEYDSTAIGNFINLMLSMGERPAQECQRTACHQAIIETARSPTFCDEVYMQILKQLSNNPFWRSKQLGWELLAEVCAQAPPSEEMNGFLRAYLKNSEESFVTDPQAMEWAPDVVRRITESLAGPGSSSTLGAVWNTVSWVLWR